MLVTERSGQLLLVEKDGKSRRPVSGVPKVRTGGQGGLLGIALSPNFAKDRLVYLSFSEPGDGGAGTAVAGGVLNDTALSGVEVIWRQSPKVGGGNHWGSRLVFARDGTLFVTTGDRYSERERAQDVSTTLGKVIRINPDGSIPKDNPFVGRAGARGEIFSYGHRNGFGLRFHPVTGELWQMEIGPMGGDEINILKPGANYGWPLVSQGRNYSGTLVSEQPWYREGMEQPRMFWVPSISPGGIAFYTGDKFPEWQNNIIVGALSAQHVERISFDNPGQAERRQILLAELHLRYRDVEIGPDGYIYLATEVRYGSGQPDGTVIRLEPVQ
jgi:glucose/arabinose dehydrogenase